ncbi:MAG: NADH-quinone oxidoreductase subunit L [Nitrososphaeria archaeon]|nr:NADH-quinone oxidoreductase subunit L [Nitrososphaeria archaeon]
MSLEYFTTIAWLSWTIPLVGAILTPLLSRIGPKARDYGAVAFSLLAMLMTLQLIPSLMMEVEWPIRSRVSWLIIPGAPIIGEVGAGMLLDPLSVVMVNVVSVVSFLIMLYSLSYMHGDPGLTRYWFFMNFFIANMLLLVLSDNLILMLIGWEGVGICSYALIGYWYQDSREGWLHYWVGEPPEAYPPSHCGMKAFMVTRLGDLFMMAGILMVAVSTGTLDFVELAEAGKIVPANLQPLLPAALILILGGAVGKSAQLPLMEWLPDAMAGPASVSALIHAATMVKAGVYLVARLFPIALEWSSAVPEAMNFFYATMWIGAVTAFIAATQAMASTELKKVLAYSTVSQIGYMMMSLGAGGVAMGLIAGYVGSIFHLMNHAVFKAALFLASGSVIHACGSRFLRDMGGLRKYMPITFCGMLLATLALMGLPPFGGFWSKDLVLTATLSAGEYVVFGIGLATAILTAFYSMRMIGLVFFGASEQRGSRVHEAPRIMWAPYTALAAGSLIIGFAAPFLEHGLEEVFAGYITIHGASHGAGGWNQLVPLFSVAAVVLGTIPAYLIYVKRTWKAEEIISKHRSLEALRRFILRRYYLNAVYYMAFVKPSLRLAETVFRGFEQGLLDRLNYAISYTARKTSDIVRRIHTGVLGHYVIGIMIGALILIALLLGGA